MITRTLKSDLVPCVLCESMSQNDICLCDMCWQDVLANHAVRVDVTNANLFEYNEKYIPQLNLVFKPKAIQTMELGNLANVWVPYHYVWPIDAWILAYKYHHAFHLEGILSKLWAAALPALADQHFDYICAVPNHISRAVKRGFNQVMPFAAMFAAHLQVVDISMYSKRLRLTQHQVMLSANQRRKNLHDVFNIQTNVENKRILIVDDVITTGTTLNAFAGRFLEQGAHSVSAIALAWAELDAR